MDKSLSDSIRILKGSIDDVEVEGNPCLRGIIAVESLPHLRIDPSYQREYLNVSTRRNIMEGLTTGQRLPDLELGMRGQTLVAPDGPLGDILLADPVFIIDGQQRRGSILEYVERFPGSDPRQGVVVHFGSTREWERRRFEALNLHHTRVSTGIIVRNMRENCTGIACIYGLTQTDRDFPLFDRVGWNQNLAVKDLISGTGYASRILQLHGHIAGGIAVTSVKEMTTAFDKLVGLIGLAQLRANTQAFFNLIEHCWEIKGLSKRGSVWLKATFLQALCDVFSDHLDFWAGDKGTKFGVPVDIRNRLEKFPVQDPEIRNLSASAGQARQILRQMLINWLEKGRRSTLHKRDMAELLSRHRSEAARDRWHSGDEERPSP